MLKTVGGTVFTLGDNVYEDGTAAEFHDCYGPSWGVSSIKSRTRPVVGNHDYHTANASGYYDYFGSAAGSPSKGYYAYNAGTWRVYALNSNCGEIGGCGAGSAQEQWLRGDLANHPAPVRGRDVAPPAVQLRLGARQQHGDEGALQGPLRLRRGARHRRARPRLRAVRAADGRRHARQGPRHRPDRGRGPAAGATTRSGPIEPNSLVRNATAYGVLRLSLSPGSWKFQFLPVAGKTFSDSGSGTCH